MKKSRCAETCVVEALHIVKGLEVPEGSFFITATGK